ncbi:MAG: alpha-galactosidase [Anaerolineae bacterium]|nr:alpha-galactosidase [Anaerolineae bacterium]
MTKIVILGAGSGFGGRLSVDIMSREVLRDATICLCDIHPGRLKMVTDYVQRTVDKYQLPTRIESTTDRKRALPGADFVITSVSVGGGAYYGYPYKAEIEIPLKYGISQSVADTVGVGGVFRFLRTGPVQHQFFRDMENLCPEAWVLNHTNPMAMLSWLHLVDSSMRYVGLCHSVQGTTEKLARIIDVPYEDVRYWVAGINHQAWVLEFTRGNEDLYPMVWQAMEDPEVIAGDSVRFEMMRHFGYFPTESTRHNSEYLPYFRKNQSVMSHFGLETRGVRDTPHRVREWMSDTGINEGEAPVGELRLSREFTTGIMEAVLTNVPFSFNGNVLNTGLITNLPEGCCVEVPCLVDGRGVHPCYVGDLPAQLAALNRTNVNVIELAVQAVLEKDREAAFHACAVDPLTAAVLSLDEIRAMFEELWDAEEGLLKWFDPTHKGPLPEICAP